MSTTVFDDLIESGQSQYDRDEAAYRHQAYHPGAKITTPVDGDWVVCYNTGAGEYSTPYFVPTEEQDSGCFGGHGHTNYALFATERAAREWADPLRAEAERYMRERAEFDAERDAALYA